MASDVPGDDANSSVQNAMSPAVVPMIVKVFGDGRPTDVPVTPETTSFDVIECCRDPGDETCDLVAISPEFGECTLNGNDRPLEILQKWGSGKLLLRYTVLSTNGETYEKRNGMKESDHFGCETTLPDGVQLTLTELREMACRQQSQIDSQHQLLAAKEQRLRYLKEQEARQQRVHAESERLRRLRDRVDAQELKLRKLRALRGQVDHQKQNNISLTSDLDSIRALFNEKEKELSLAVAKVEELTRQLEELKRGRSLRDPPPASALELDKLRRELMYRNKLNEQQNHRLNQQREALTARQEEMSAIDKRISELQERLHRKRLLNQQLANQISAASHKAAYHQLVRLTNNNHNDQNNQNFVRKPNQHTSQLNTGLPRGNIATVEPYNHVPLQPNGQPRTVSFQENPTYHPAYQQQHIKRDPRGPEYFPNQINEQAEISKTTNIFNNRQEEVTELKDFLVSKSDPKYQTLPYNTKFAINSAGQNGKQNGTLIENVDNRAVYTNNSEQNIIPSANVESKDPTDVTFASSAYHQTAHITVHSAPLNLANKNIATPLSHNDLVLSRRNSLEGLLAPTTNLKQSETSNLPNTFQKPISSVAPTPSQLGVYQTSSTRVQPVEPQTTALRPAALTTNNTSSSSLALSSPQSTSTPYGTPESAQEKLPSVRPALPPKPAIKPPPRQTPVEPPSKDSSNNSSPILQQRQNSSSQLFKGPKEGNNRMSNLMVGQNGIQIAPNDMIIKAKPLTIKKQAFGEAAPRLRNLMIHKSNLNTKRLELPPQINNDSELFEKHLINGEDGSSEKSHAITQDEVDKARAMNGNGDMDIPIKKEEVKSEGSVVRRCKKGNLKQNGKVGLTRRVSFDPLALLLDASLEGELELVKKTCQQVSNPSAANDEGITALHNAICAGHLEVMRFLVEFGCDVNAQDCDGWTPLHCAASCNSLAMVRFLVEHGACVFAQTLSDRETAAEKCEEDEEGFDGCSEYLYSVQEKLGILSNGQVYAVFDYMAQQPDELSFQAGQQLMVLRKGDENEREWWWCRLGDKEGYVPRNLLGLYPRVTRNEE